MIVLDTHIQIWWSEDDNRLTDRQRSAIESERRQFGSIGISPISCIEVARLAAASLIELPTDALTWIRHLMNYPSVRLLPITPEIAVRAYSLPEPFHRDPADRILVATAIELACPLLTSDQRILQYPHVDTIA